MKIEYDHYAKALYIRVQEKERESVLTEDEKFRYKEEMQK